jgi:hypothetical protein
MQPVDTSKTTSSHDDGDRNIGLREARVEPAA